jgi:hypothetical protein
MVKRIKNENMPKRNQEEAVLIQFLLQDVFNLDQTGLISRQRFLSEINKRNESAVINLKKVRKGYYKTFYSCLEKIKKTDKKDISPTKKKKLPNNTVFYRLKQDVKTFNKLLIFYYENKKFFTVHLLKTPYQKYINKELNPIIDGFIDYLNNRYRELSNYKEDIFTKEPMYISITNIGGNSLMSNLHIGYFILENYPHIYLSWLICGKKDNPTTDAFINIYYILNQKLGIQSASQLVLTCYELNKLLTLTYYKNSTNQSVLNDNDYYSLDYNIIALKESIKQEMEENKQK